MDGTRCMTWKEFKESLNNIAGKKILYVDEEGTEIPINTDAEFQEALRLAKKQGNRVRFVLVNESSDEGKQGAQQSSKPKEKYVYKETKHSKTYVNEEPKEAVYVNDVAPEWFVSFMKKFKKELLAEVNIMVYDNIRKTLKKEAKLYDERYAKDCEYANTVSDCFGTQYYYRSEDGYETPAYFVTNKPLPTSGSVRIRSTEKVYLDQLKDDRRGKQFAKMEKGRVSSLDRRQKLERWTNVPTIGHEEKIKTSKSRAYPKVYISYVHDFGPMKSTKSASFTSNLSLKKLEVLQPYALWFLLGNNGSVPWSNNTYVKCFYNPDEFDFEDDVIELPSLEPGVGANVVYEVTPLKVGSFSFTCAIIDNGVEIGDRILCRFEVVDEEGMIKIPKPTKIIVPKKDTQQQCETQDDDFTKTQKKIKDNIKTIMKRLDDIEVLNTDSSQKGDSKKEDESVKVGQKRNRKKRKEGATVELRTGVFDLLQNLESIRENEEGKPKDEEKEVVKDTLVGTDDKQADVEEKKEKENENGEEKNEEGHDGSDGDQSTKDERKKEAANAERRDSDSELSVIMGSEEDDNFIVLSMPSRTPSPETQVKELENEQEKENNKEKEEEKAKEQEKQKEKAKEQEKQKEKAKEQEKQKEKAKEQEKQKEKAKEQEKQKENAKEQEKQKEKAKEQEKQKEKAKEQEKPKEKGKEKEAMQKQSPREEEKKNSFESNTFDPWNEKKTKESTRFDPWNEKKSQPDPFDDAPKDNNEKKKNWGFHVFNFPEGTTQINSGDFCVLTPTSIQGAVPEDIVAKLKNIAMIHKNGVLVTPKEKKEENLVYVVDRGGKCVPVVNGMPKDGAEIGKQKVNAGTGKQKENGETKENKGKEGQGENSGGASPQGSSTGNEQPKVNPDNGNLPNLLLYNAASDAINRVASVLSNIHSAFIPGGTEKKMLSEKRRPIRIMELLGYLEDMGFTDRIRNRELLLRHNLNMPAVIEELLDTTPSVRNNPPTGIFVSKQGVFGRF